MDITGTLDQLKAERQNPVYTPPIGTTVQWFDRGQGDPRAAIVTAIERPGVVSLTVFALNSGPAFKRGVLWAKSSYVKAKLDAADPNIVRNGTWNYPPEEKPPRTHEQFHASDIERREEAAHRQKAEYDQAEAARKARQEEDKKLQTAGA